MPSERKNKAKELRNKKRSRAAAIWLVAEVTAAICGVIVTAFLGPLISPRAEKVLYPWLKPKIVLFLAQQDDIVGGGSTKLRWEVDPRSNAEVFINDEKVKPLGDKVVSPTVNTTYILRARNRSGLETIAQATVRVKPGPTASEVTQPLRPLATRSARPKLAVLGLEKSAGVRNRASVAQAVTERMNAMFREKYEVLAVPERSGSVPDYLASIRSLPGAPDYAAYAVIGARTDTKNSNLLLAKVSRVEVTAQVTLRMVRVRDGALIREAAGKAKKAANVSWQTPVKMAGGSGSQAELETQAINQALAEAAKKFRGGR